MKIAVLDGATLNPGDLDWGELDALGECLVYPRTSPGQIVKRAADAEIVIVNKVEMKRETIAQLPQLKYIGVTATGYNCVAVDAARENGIPVTNVPTYGTASVAQMVFALLLELTQHVGHHSHVVHEGRWSECDNFCFWDYPLVELQGLCFGVVGLGRIGRNVAAIAGAFGMNVIAYDPFANVSADSGVTAVSMDKLFRSADVVSLHCPLTPDTKHIVNAERLAAMKPSAFLINTSRGPLVDEAALARALDEGVIAGAGLDVLSAEPPPTDIPLLGARNCVITPHISWATRGARQRLMDASITNVRAFIEGNLQNVVN